jgi:N-methylhydantoinase B
MRAQASPSTGHAGSEEPNHDIDPLTLEVVRRALEATANEMSLIMLRTAHSPIFSEARDFSCAIHDPSGEAIAQAHDCPIHLASIQVQLAECIKALGGSSALSEGDVIVANDPYLGGSHLPDITMFKPIFAHGELVAFAANRAHHVDVGGWTPGSFTSDAEEIFQEGIRIPPVKLFRKGQPARDVWELILSNVRDPESTVGDLHAQAACLGHAERKIRNDLIPKFGFETLKACAGPILAYSEKRMKEQLEAFPDGEYLADDFVDDDGITGGAHRIRVKITIDGPNAAVDFTGSAPQARGPINSPFSVTAAGVYIAFLTMTDPTIPANAGCYRPIKVIAPSGSVVNPVAPAACAAGNTYTATRIVDTVRRALSGADPSRAAAGNGDHLILIAAGKDPETGERYHFLDLAMGGWGGRSSKPGESSAMSLIANCWNVPIEVLETRAPWRVTEVKLAEGSAGDGAHCGGLGVEKEYLLLRGEARVTLVADRCKHAPWGFDGGDSAEVAGIFLRSGDEERPLPSKQSNIVVRPGDVIRMRAPGGGGYGRRSD